MKLFISLAVVIPFFAFAQEQSNVMTVTETSDSLLQMRSLSEALYFPSAGDTTFKVTPRFRSQKRDYKGINSGDQFSRERSSQTVEIAFDHGIANTDWALHFDTFFGSAESTSIRNGRKGKFKYNGTGDLNLQASRFQALKSGNLISGVALTYSPENIKSASTNQSGNMNSGGHSLTPFLAYEASTSYGSAGGRLAYQINGDVKEDAQDGETMTYAGQNTISLMGFSELKKASYLVGVALGLDMANRGTYSSNRGEKGELDATTGVNGGIYSKIAMSESVTLRPAVEYRTLLNREVNNLEYTQDDNFVGSVGLSLVF